MTALLDGGNGSMNKLALRFLLGAIVAAVCLLAYHQGMEEGIHVGVERVASTAVVVKHLSVDGKEIDMCMNYHVWDRCVPFEEWEVHHATSFDR